MRKRGRRRKRGQAEEETKEDRKRIERGGQGRGG